MKAERIKLNQKRRSQEELRRNFVAISRIRVKFKTTGKVKARKTSSAER